MSIESLKDALPDLAKDLKLNLGSLSRNAVLSPEQLWGTMLATAAATRNATVLREIAEEAREHLSPAAYDAALGAASIMGMNNVFYRGRHFLEGDYDDLRVGLRMSIIGNPGVDKSLFELWSLAASAVNGCQACVGAHESVVREAGLSREHVFEALKAASVIAGVSQAIMIDDTLSLSLAAV
ncbi:MAG: carboxymuconolactone decarboxylase family protein [Micrococcales bacterium]|nr:carboxymuconolactone decarboxylase family protein [Micrococcales bacterium]